MGKWTKFLMAAVLAAVGMAGSVGATPSVRDVIAQTDAIAMPDWQLPDIDRSLVAPGLRLWVLNEARLPTVELFFLFPHGTFADADTQLGRNELMAAAWRAGGTVAHSPEAFAQALERRAIAISVDPKPEYTLVTLSCLKPDLPVALDLFKEWFLHPRFDADRFDLVKRQMAQELREIADYPERLAAYVYPQLVYGPRNKWGRMLRLRDIESVSRQAVQSAYGQMISAGPVLVGATGDVTATDVRGFVADLWKDKSLPLASSPAFVPMARKAWPVGVTLIPKAGDQSTVLVGHLGERRTNPDKFALLLANYMIGGDAFNSVLGSELRVTRGLVYGIYSSYGIETDYGIFRIYGKTSAGKTEEVLDFIRKGVADVVSGKSVTVPALELAKRAILSSLLFSNERKGDLLTTLMTFDHYGYSPTYLETFVTEIKAVTIEDIRRVSRLYFYPDRFTVLVVGPQNLSGSLGVWTPSQIVPAEALLD